MTSFKSASIILFLTAFLLLPLACKPPSQLVTVTKVVDGDTIIIKGGYHVRYIGIDSPERDEQYYAEATQLNKDLVEGKQVRLESDVNDRDEYGRLLRYVYVGDTFVNAEMVRQGWAWSIAYPPDIKYQVYLEAIEKEARKLKRGFWQ